ncbi:cilia- and flagella-associated protein 61 isoform X1 [Drosophila pseudoobscura]|uniref:Cilia- and flagella-associated protein 61 isoform X1 n=1 Tax=Drosophila pseudoobscura pseudoobscura TaxID=46245 RepID=A0A6I8UT45_DROPS|nr:cilia- and flagella-associated protein 61 isoform X1 [Drosophila pseudoobscura]
MDYHVRTADIYDLDAIDTLIHSPTVKWFGNIRPKYVEKAKLFKCYQTYRMVVLHRETSSMIAYAEFRNYPAIDALPSDCWLEWLSVRYCLTMPLSFLNTMFFNFCVYKSENDDAIASILRELFYRENRVWFLITVKNPSIAQPTYYVETFDDLEKYADVYYPREFSVENNFNTQELYIVYRFKLMRKITYRKALPEDNDDIVAIHEYEYPEMREELGDFYIAEEILRTDSGREKSFLIVAETENDCQEIETAVFIWLSTDIDIRFYVTNYELESFGNLVKTIEGQSVYVEMFNVSSVQAKNAACLFTSDALDDLSAMTILGGLQKNDSGLSVYSGGKAKVSSINGRIIEANYTSGSNRFFMRESLFSKMKYIIGKLSNSEYYISKELKSISVVYSAGMHPRGSELALDAASNVFVLKYIAARKDFPLERLFNSVVAMFCAFPDRDYCMMLISKETKSIRSHVEVLKYFMPVASRPSEVANPEEVYITHRSTIFGEISLYELQKEDVAVIQALAVGPSVSDVKSDGSFGSSTGSSFSYTSKINESAELKNEIEVITAVMKDVLENELSEFAVYTIRCGNSAKAARENTAIGFVVLRQFRSHHHLHYHYHLPRHQNYLNFLRAEIISLRLHPLFMISSDLIFRDLAMKTSYRDYYFVSSPNGHQFTNDLKKMMTVVEPNPMKKSPTTFRVPKEEDTLKERLNLTVHNFYQDHLIIYRHKLNPTKWFGNSERLVVIGFTDVAKAFLRQLVFQWNSKDHQNSETYTCLPRVQVTVITMPGVVEAEFDGIFQCPYCCNSGNCYLSFQNVSCYVRDVTFRMDLRHWVHFVPGRIDFINREKKFVKLENSCEIYYDTLLLACYKDFAMRTLNSRSAMAKNLPCNFVEINSRLKKLLLFYKVRAVLEEMPRTYKILVYGSNLQTYECIAFLTSHGVEPSRIVLVQPRRITGITAEEKLKNPYWDKNLQYILDDILIDSGIELVEDHDFVRWVEDDSFHFIMEVVFEHFPSKKQTSFECDLFIAFDEGHMAPRRKKLLKQCGIQLRKDDILVNEDFQTNDPNIYAVGKFIQMKGAPNYQYKYTSERELGRKLMHILNLTPKPDNFEYKYSEPLFFQALLPLNYVITKVTMPRRYLASQLPPEFACNLTTYKDNTFCRVCLAHTMLVDEIVVVSNKGAHLDYLEHFCGRHELLLNNLKARFSAKTIDCFLMFFQEPWTELIMHENFQDLQEKNHELLRPVATSNLNKANRNPFMDVAVQDFITLNKRYLEQKLLNFLREHRRDFHHPFALPEDFLTPGTAGWDSDPETEAEIEEVTIDM